MTGYPQARRRRVPAGATATRVGADAMNVSPKPVVHARIGGTAAVRRSMIESGGDGAGRSYASAFPWTPADGPGTGDVGVHDGEIIVDGEMDADGEMDGVADGRVRAALAPLERLATLPVREHVAVFEQVFTELETTLATVAGEGRADAAVPSAHVGREGGDASAAVDGRTVDGRTGDGRSGDARTGDGGNGVRGTGVGGTGMSGGIARL